MNSFEKQIGETLQAYRDAKVANIHFLFPPMRAAGLHGHMPCYVPVGKAPYDLAGFYYDSCATSIGVELKESRDHENRLPIVGPGSKGNGVHYHQLDALVQVHHAGGQGLLLYNNGGEIGRLFGPDLVRIKLQYDASMKAEAAKKEVAKGSRSIPWGDFHPVKYNGDEIPLWLPKPPANSCTREVA